MHPIHQPTTRARIMPALVALVAVALFISCAGRTGQPYGPDRLIPPDQSRSTFSPDVPPADLEIISQAARALTCQHPAGCSCFLDGLPTSCAFVFSCIDSGFCECVSGCANVGE